MGKPNPEAWFWAQTCVLGRGDTGSCFPCVVPDASLSTDHQSRSCSARPQSQEWVWDLHQSPCAAGCAAVTPDLEESVAARWECGWAAPAATHLSPARMKMEQGRRRTGCCSWVLNGKPLSLVDCFQVSQPLGSESCSSCHAAGTSPCWAAQSQGKQARKASAIPCVLWAEEWKVVCPPCAWGPFQCGL